MCRILALQADEPLDVTPWVRVFAEACRSSPEYQGHGWGLSWLPPQGIADQPSDPRTEVDEHGWRRYRTTTPIWDDEVPEVVAGLVIVHARSAFRNEGIEVGNNMPFLSDGMAFAFNGELRGVRLSVPGETGAARLLGLLRRFRASAPGGTEEALRRLDEVVVARTEYVRALNLVVAEKGALFVHSRYSEDPEYFGMHRLRAPGLDVVCSMPLSEPGAVDHRVAPGRRWESVANGATFGIRSGEREHACSS